MPNASCNAARSPAPDATASASTTVKQRLGKDPLVRESLLAPSPQESLPLVRESLLAPGPQQSLPARATSQHAARTDWSRLPGATARLFPSEQMIRLLCRAWPELRTARPEYDIRHPSRAQADSLCHTAGERHQPARTAVDIGCGNGRNTLALAALGFERIVAIDPSPTLVEQCARAARQSGHAIDARVGGLPHLPCQPAEADVAVAWGVMYVLGTAAAVADAMAALARAVNPGGLLITDWRAEGDDLMQYADRRLDEPTFVLNAAAPLSLAGAAYSFWSESAVRAVHEAAGFDIIDLQHEEIRETRPQRAWRWWQASARRRSG